MASSDYLLDLDFSISYGPLDDRLNSLYLPALARSVRYDRTTGLFSASALAIAARGVDALIRNRGHMRLLVGAGLEDGDAGDVGRIQGLQKILRDKFLSLLDVVDPWMNQRLELLGWMAAEKTLDIRVALPLKDGKNPGGTVAIAHDLPRLGIFTDAEGNQLGFYGTISESSDAGDQNYEHLMVYKSWEPGGLYLQAIRQHFERLWEGKEPGWRSLPLPGAVIDRLIEFCPRKAPVRDRRADASPGKSGISPDVKKAIIDQFLQDIPYFPADETDRSHEKSRHEGEGVLQEAAALENPESCRLPLVRLESASPDPLVVYYHLRSSQINPLRSIAELEGVVFNERVFEDAPDAPSAASEIKAREHFHALLKAREDSRLKDRHAARQQERLALVQTAQRVLVKAALCDIAKSRHATLFDEDLITAGFDGATILRQRKKGFPFAELISWINPDECLRPAMNDPFWPDVEGKPPKQIETIEAALTKEGRGLAKKWTEMSDKIAVETVFPIISVRRYFMRDQKEKPRLTLVIGPGRKERFTRYLPFYSMESAFDEFVQGKDAAEEGWMEVGIGKKLDKSMFVMRIEGQAMEPLISDGHFAVFDSDIRGSLDEAILFVYGKDIYDPSRNGHLTVRRFRSGSADAKTREYREVILDPLHSDYQRLHLKNLEKGAFKIIARFVCGV
ncbi:MAG: hypothetical protein CVU53_01435 [Deltaproteobacteria bacterium HGW-Deltaproteobacteria-11]|nr:MAG: hypothetical protein CVU53_01435 [Deltaproteobacteria bacterium HGW-Deltaproteobacteria-11]